MSTASFRELKGQARELLMGRHLFLALVTLLVFSAYLALISLLSYLFPANTGNLGFLLPLCCSVLINIVYYLLYAGMTGIYLKLCRGQELRFGQLVSAFSSRPEPVALLAVVQFAIQSACAYGGMLLLTQLLHPDGRFSPALICAAAAALFFLFAWTQLGLSMAFFVYSDAPHLSGFQLILESLRLMRRHRIRLFLLLLSFIGVLLLSLLSGMIGFLLVQPYLCTTQCLFYLDLRQSADASRAS